MGLEWTKAHQNCGDFNQAEEKARQIFMIPGNILWTWQNFTHICQQKTERRWISPWKRACMLGFAMSYWPLQLGVTKKTLSCHAQCMFFLRAHAVQAPGFNGPSGIKHHLQGQKVLRRESDNKSGILKNHLDAAKTRTKSLLFIKCANLYYIYPPEN